MSRGNGRVGAALACSSLPCGWRARGSAREGFAVREGSRTFGNPNTGVRTLTSSSRSALRENEAFLGSYMLRGEDALLEVDGLDLQEPVKLDFWVYRATVGIKLDACTTDDCVELVDPERVEANAREWVRKELELPVGTDRLSIEARNEGNNQGGVGLARIFLTDGTGSNVCGDRDPNDY